MAENVRGQNRGGPQERSEASRDRQRSNTTNSQQATSKRASTFDTRNYEVERDAARRGVKPKYFSCDYDGQLSDE